MTVRDPEKVVWLSQTTLSASTRRWTRCAALRERFPTLQNPPSDDICYATQNRQVAVKAMAPQCDLVLVVGSTNSSNSVRLVEVALSAGAGAAHLDRLRPRRSTRRWLDGVETVGVTSGASVPEVLVRGVLDHLAERGWNDGRGDHDRRGDADVLVASRAAPEPRRALTDARARSRSARTVAGLGPLHCDPDDPDDQHGAGGARPSSGTR